MPLDTFPTIPNSVISRPIPYTTAGYNVIKLLRALAALAWSDTTLTLTLETNSAQCEKTGCLEAFSIRLHKLLHLSVDLRQVQLPWRDDLDECWNGLAAISVERE